MFVHRLADRQGELPLPCGEREPAVLVALGWLYLGAKLALN
jgi:hypothetical protein